MSSHNYHTLSIEHCFFLRYLFRIDRRSTEKHDLQSSNRTHCSGVSGCVGYARTGSWVSFHCQIMVSTCVLVWLVLSNTWYDLALEHISELSFQWGLVFHGVFFSSRPSGLVGPSTLRPKQNNITKIAFWHNLSSFQRIAVDLHDSKLIRSDSSIVINCDGCSGCMFRTFPSAAHLHTWCFSFEVAVGRLAHEETKAAAFRCKQKDGLCFVSLSKTKHKENVASKRQKLSKTYL